MLVINKTYGYGYGSSQESKVREYYARERRGFSLELDMTLTSE